MIDFQEVIAFSIVGFALIYIIYTLFRKNTAESECGGCSKCAAGKSQPSSTIEIIQK
ncbi:MAG: FeoB-associated Cys-rich membrane protein [Calditrichia bacterium]